LMRAPYRTQPGEGGTVLYSPFIRVRLGRPRGPATRFFEALVDSGAADCIFDSRLAEAIGIDLTECRTAQRLGIGGTEDVWTAPVVLYVGEHSLNITASFIPNLPVAGLLGRVGFFEHFKITFDPSGNPPGLELERVYKS
jgi:hypothetical protein